MARARVSNPPDGEIAALQSLPAAAEFALPPPEVAVQPSSSAPEIAPPPPEYAKGLTTAETTARKKRRGFPKLAAAALASLIVFSSVGGKHPNAGPAPGGEIAETGDVQLISRYAELRDGAVHYSYYPFMPDPNDPQQMSGDIPLPIEVYARVTDASGGSAAPAQEPDVWMSSRGVEDYSIDAQGLSGDLTLTLTAIYTQGGAEKKTVLSVPVTEAAAAEGPTIELGYALTDGETVFYSYYVNVPRDEDGYEDEKYWPVTVYPTAESEDGQTAYGDTDLWEYSRASQFAYELRLLDEMPGELTLKLTATYETDGETHTISAQKPIEQMPAGEAFAFLWIQDDGTADFKGALTASADDPHEYELEPMMLWAEAYDGDMQNLGGFWSLQDEAELERDYFEESGNKEYVFHRMAAIDEPPENAKYCRFRFYMRDSTNGYIYQLESNICPLPAKRYALGDEQIEIVVYNDTLIFDYPNPADEPGYVTVLLRTTVNAADFTDMELPLPLVPEGFRSTGYVVHYGSPFDNGYDAYEDGFGRPVYDPPEMPDDFDGEPPAEYYVTDGMFAFPLNGLTLTKEMVERVPVASDGVRYINVHATWALTTGDEEFVVELDDGQGNVTEYPVAHPIASEGYFFTFTFPQPTPPLGYYFDGWYDENGKRVDFLIDYFSFTPYMYDEDGRFIGFDWGQRSTVRLIAHWLPY